MLVCAFLHRAHGLGWKTVGGKYDLLRRPFFFLFDARFLRPRLPSGRARCGTKPVLSLPVFRRSHHLRHGVWFSAGYVGGTGRHQQPSGAPRLGRGRRNASGQHDRPWCGNGVYQRRRFNDHGRQSLGCRALLAAARGWPRVGARAVSNSGRVCPPQRRPRVCSSPHPRGFRDV